MNDTSRTSTHYIRRRKVLPAPTPTMFNDEQCHVQLEELPPTCIKEQQTKPQPAPTKAQQLLLHKHSIGCRTQLYKNKKFKFTFKPSIMTTILPFPWESLPSYGNLCNIASKSFTFSVVSLHVNAESKIIKTKLMWSLHIPNLFP